MNCLGAWSPILAAKIGVADPTEPVRRQISLVDVHPQDLAPGVELAQLGMIVDASGLYFHPEGAHVLAGYSTPQEAPGYDFEYDGRDFFEAEIWPRMAHRASSFGAASSSSTVDSIIAPVDSPAPTSPASDPPA